LYGYNYADDYMVSQHADWLSAATDALGQYRARSKDFTWLHCGHFRLIILNFEHLGGGGKRGTNQGGWVEIFLDAHRTDSTQIVHTLAHEYAHPVYKRALNHAKATWADFCTATVALDLMRLLQLWPVETQYLWESSPDLATVDPELYAQVESTGFSPDYVDWYKTATRHDVEAMVTAPQVPANPITGYAVTSPEEAFCEAAALWVTHGEATLPARVLQQVKFVLGTV
jgi:xanthine/CO dehydrogenase XdhC/CoxF family maturation factor